MNIAELKTLLISAKNELNSMLTLNRTKKIKYDEEKYFELITFLSLWNVSGENGSEIMNLIDDVPSGDALMQQIQKLDLDLIEAQFDSIFENQYRKMFKKKRPNVVAIIDIHEQETYSKDKRISPNIRGGKHKNGTNFFFKFATIQILYKEKILTMKCKLHRRGQSQNEIVKNLVMHVHKYVKIKVLLLDRGFRDVKIFNELEFLQVPVLMPCIKDRKTRKEFEKSRRKFRITKFWWRNVKGEYADFKLIMMKLNNGKEIGFYTTLRLPWLHEAQYFLNLYAKRWNIETGYRLQNMFLPKTTCVKGVVRYFYFCYAIAMHNLWISIKFILKKIKFTVTNMKFVLVYYWITTHLSFEL